MRTFAQEQKVTQGAKSGGFSSPGRGFREGQREADPVLHPQRSVEHDSLERRLQAHGRELQDDVRVSTASRIERDFSRVPVYADPGMAIQEQLEVSTPGDASEQEADRIAERVMYTGDSRRPRAGAGGGHTGLQTAVDPHRRLRIMPARADDSDTVPLVVPEALKSAGRPLDSSVRAFMETRFAHDFSRVRVHTGARADQACRDLRARAFTLGSDVVFRQGAYSPDSIAGKYLLAHELAHTVQQSGETVSHRIHRQHQTQGGDDPRWLLSGKGSMTFEPDKTSATGYAPNIVSRSALRKTATPEATLSILGACLAFLRECDKKVDSIKGKNDTQRAGAQVYGSQGSSKDSPGSKPDKKFYDMGSGDATKLDEYFGLILLALGDRMPTSSKAAMRTYREKFDKFSELKDPQKLAEFAYEKVKEFQEIVEELERAEKARALSESAKSSSVKGQSPTKAEATKISDGSRQEISIKPLDEFTVPAEGGKREYTGWWQVFLAAKDGSGTFLLEQVGFESRFEIKTNGDELYLTSGVHPKQLVDHYLKGYTYRYVGSPTLKNLLPDH